MPYIPNGLQSLLSHLGQCFSISLNTTQKREFQKFSSSGSKSSKGFSNGQIKSVKHLHLSFLFLRHLTVQFQSNSLAMVAPKVAEIGCNRRQDGPKTVVPKGWNKSLLFFFLDLYIPYGPRCRHNHGKCVEDKGK